MRSPVLWAGLAAVVLAGAGATWVMRLGFARLHDRALPGFELALPTGAITRQDTNYSDGRFAMGMVAGVAATMQVQWGAGGLDDDDDVDVANKTLAATLGAEARPIPITEAVKVPGAQQTRSWAVRLGDRSSWSTQIVCGARQVTLRTASSHWGVERLHRRVAASFRCRPDAAKERTVGDIPVVFDVKGEWSRLAITPGALQITDGRFMLMAQHGDVRTIKGETLRALEAARPGWKIGDQVGDDWPIEISEDGAAMRGWMSLRPCPEGGQLFVMAFGEAQDRKQARALLGRARCRRPDEAPQTWPGWPRELKLDMGED